MNAATTVFAIPELLEHILLSLPRNTTHEEIATTRLLHLSRTTSPTWHTLLSTSTPLRQALYLPSNLDHTPANNDVWQYPTPFPPAQPNPWIPHLLLHQRSWGSAWPFEIFPPAFNTANDHTQSRLWTFSFELSRAQHNRLPTPGSWRDMQATSPPFTDAWYTRSFYELGSGRAPFVTHLDYQPRVAKSAQRYRMHCASGVTLGMIVDAVSELFEKHPNAKFVLVESLRREGDGMERPLIRSYMPGLSAERESRWH